MNDDDDDDDDDEANDDANADADDDDDDDDDGNGEAAKSMVVLKSIETEYVQGKEALLMRTCAAQEDLHTANAVGAVARPDMRAGNGSMTRQMVKGQRSEDRWPLTLLIDKHCVSRMRVTNLNITKIDTQNT